MSRLICCGLDAQKKAYLLAKVEIFATRAENELGLAEKSAPLTLVCPEGLPDKTIYAPPLVEEYGMGGRAFESGVVLSISLPRTGLTDPHDERTLYALVGHEFLHYAHYQQPWAKGGLTIGKAAMQEGLACAFESEFAGQLPFYACFANSAEAAKVLKLARDLIDAPLTPSSDLYNGFFYGSAEYPRHAGYAFGYALTSQWLRVKNLQPSQALAIDPQEPLDWWKKTGFPPLLAPTRDRYPELTRAPFALRTNHK